MRLTSGFISILVVCLLIACGDSHEKVYGALKGKQSTFGDPIDSALILSKDKINFNGIERGIKYEQSGPNLNVKLASNSNTIISIRDITNNSLFIEQNLNGTGGKYARITENEAHNIIAENKKPRKYVEEPPIPDFTSGMKNPFKKDGKST